MGNHNIVGNLRALAHAEPRQWEKAVAAAGTPERITRRAISSINHKNRNGTALVTTSVAHGLKVDDEVRISGANETAFNNQFTVLTVPSTTTFTIEVPETAEAEATGTVVLDADIWFVKAIVLGLKSPRVPNLNSVFYGADSTNDSQPHEVLAGEEAKIEAPAGRKYNLKDWWLDVVTAADGVVITLS